MHGEQLAGELQEARRQLAERDRQLEELRAQLEAQRLEEGNLARRQPEEQNLERPEGQRLADGAVIRRRRVVPERIEYRRALEHFANFVANELGNGGAPRPRPDDREWRMQRAKTIEKLNELREKLDTVCVGANRGKAVGTGAGILGSGGALVGAILTLSGSPIGPTYVNVGNLLCNAGYLMGGVSNGIESLFSAKYLNDIEEVLKKDKELSGPLAEWLNFSNKLDANVVEIFGASLASKKFNISLEVFSEFMKCRTIAGDFDSTMKLMRAGRYSVHIGTDVLVEKLEKLFHHLDASPQLADRIRFIFSVLSAGAQGVQYFRVGVQFCQKMTGTSSSFVVPSLQGGLNPDIPTAGQVKGFCAFQAIKMASSVIELINVASIIRHGKSRYSDAIKQLTRALAAELRMMEEL